MADNTQQTEDIDLMSQDVTDDVREDLQRLMADGEGEEESEESGE